MTQQEFQDEQTRAVCLLPAELQNVVAHAGWMMTEANAASHPTYTAVVANTRKLADALVEPCRQYAARIRRESEPDRRF